MSLHPSTSKRLFGSSLSVDCQCFHLRGSFPRDWGNGMCLSQYNILPPRHVTVEPHLLKSMALNKQADGGRGNLRQKIDFAFG